MHQHVGFTKEQWEEFVSRLDDDFSPEHFRKCINAAVRRYKAHARASLQAPGSRLIEIGSGVTEKVDEKFLQAVERECPVDDPFRTDFRIWASEMIDPFDDNRGSKGAIRSEILQHACLRYIIRLMPEDARIDRPVPARPLSRLRNHPFVGKMRNEVFIEEVRPHYPIALVPKASLLEGTVLPVMDERTVRNLPERYPEERHRPRRRYDDCGSEELDDLHPIVFCDDKAPPDDL